jgi:mono/diheme cytochrome c family protein
MPSLRSGALRRAVRFSSVVLTGAFAVLSARYLAARPSAASEGEATYNSKCAGCHGPDGSGQTSMGKMMKLGDLRSAEVQKKTDAELVAIITNGKSPMPAYGKQLDKEKIQQVVAYLRELAKKH